MSIEAMKLALAARETCRIRSVSEWSVEDITPKNVTAAIAALRTALPQAEAQQPVTGEPVAHLWQHGETGRTRIVMLGDVWTANDHWCYVGTLVLGSTHPAPSVPDEKPLPDLMMASYHEAIGWNACRAAMLAAKDTK